MHWLNYHHLLCFWMTAREGSIARACEQLDLAQPAINMQLRQLERAIGERLFHRVGRSLVLTETGQVVFRYAEEIFSLGRELDDVLRGKPMGSPMRLLVGLPDVLPKLVAYRVREIGRLDAVRERYYAISVERRLKHPALKAISEAARSTLFA